MQLDALCDGCYEYGLGGDGDGKASSRVGFLAGLMPVCRLTGVMGPKGAKGLTNLGVALPSPGCLLP
jgi:hypothetical protein